MDERTKRLLDDEKLQWKAKKKQERKPVLVGSARLVREHRGLCRIPVDQLTAKQKERIATIEHLYGNRPILKEDVARMIGSVKEMYYEQYEKKKS